MLVNLIQSVPVAEYNNNTGEIAFPREQTRSQNVSIVSSDF